MKITVCRNGPYRVEGGVPLSVMEICDDAEGFCRSWMTVREFPLQQTYSLCRCGHSRNPPFCDGFHERIDFDGTETAGSEPYLGHPEMTGGPALELADYKNLCVHARFCMRAGTAWNLTEQSGSPAAKETAIEEVCNCPSGRLVLRDRATGVIIEPALKKSIAVVEYPPKSEHGPLWVRGGIPVISADGIPYTLRNRLTLCRCGRSQNKPFCDGSHVQQ
jgi:CDGSH-type Zn-finger protein